MVEGLFWLICTMSGSGVDWGADWEILHLFAKSNSISHKDAWEQLRLHGGKYIKQYNYNHYPRGRVVVRNSKATVFLNQHIVTDDVISKINHIFCLTAPKIHAEGGVHYRCYIDLIINSG